MRKAHVVKPSVYVICYLALMVLLGLTVLVAQFPLGPLGLAVAMLIAAVKAAIVLLYFMHVRYSTPLMALFAMVGVVWLALLIGGTFSDVLTRTWYGWPPDTGPIETAGPTSMPPPLRDRNQADSQGTPGSATMDSNPSGVHK